ncbi:MarR family transcriptional regulator [Azospirillum sp. A26]|uniref:HVO_A0114 family putative DNA-binding protein n=1 Tax=Azospirillum sp. A26 TaxID=3160607 RepID=UPI0036720FE8
MTDLKITVGQSLRDIAAEVVAAVHRVERGEAVEPESSINFADWETLARTLTGKRLELLRHLHRQPTASVRALAMALRRDYSNVHADVQALTEAGLIERSEDGGLRAEYDGIQTRIAL